MDYSQYIRLKNEAANSYVSRTKTVDASFLTYKRNQKAVYSGYNDIQSIPYYRGSPVVNNILYDLSSCPVDHQFTEGYTTVNKQGQHEALAMRKAGCAVCSDPDYSIVSPGIQLQSYTEQRAILAQYDNISTSSGLIKPYGYGLMPGVCKPEECGPKTFFPPKDRRTNDVYPPAAWPYK